MRHRNQSAGCHHLRRKVAVGPLRLFGAIMNVWVAIHSNPGGIIVNNYRTIPDVFFSGVLNAFTSASHGPWPGALPMLNISSITGRNQTCV